MGITASYYIERLSLIEHPEGGYFAEVYRSEEEIPEETLPERYHGKRSFSTSIYFLITSEKFSAFHQVNSDEGWHYYTGNAPIHLHTLSPKGELKTIKLGPNLAQGEQFQYVVPANHWFAAEVPGEDTFALVGCTVAPGFDFADFELAEREPLKIAFPAHQGIISRLTRVD
ncbi:MAG: cupin domain-containing protein [Bacteroidota bacterium]